ncbi:unnamed protein product [Meloidogyne enterolobii]|uniref:Uncharacterized protein n=1 Tax=Meloidogyne enterolobii TaxID=390850 RepID=A0ACB0XNM6_MELEN
MYSRLVKCLSWIRIFEIYGSDIGSEYPAISQDPTTLFTVKEKRFLGIIHK